jgi:type I restriction enzyme S subunit
VPDGWAVVPLSDLLASMESGSRPRGGVRGIATGVPSLGGEHLTYEGGFNFTSVKFVPRDFYDRMRRGRIQVGDVLIVKDGATTGKVALVSPDFPFDEAAANEHIFVCRPKSVSSEYVFWFLISDEGQRRVLEHFKGSAQGGISQTFASQTLVPVAPPSLQQTIVELLNSVHAKRTSAHGHAARARQAMERFRRAVLAAACSGRLTESWRERHPDNQPPFPISRSVAAGRGRPGRLWGGGSVPELTDQERQSVPESWTWLKVSQLGFPPEATVQIGPMSMRSSEFTSSGRPVLNVGSVQDGYIDVSKRNFLPSERAKSFERYRVQEGDVLFTRSGTVGRCAVAAAEHADSLITFHLLRVRTDPGICLPRYLWCAFVGSPSISRQRNEAQIGSTRAGFNTALLAGIDVPVPPLREQEEVVRRVDNLLRSASSAESNLAETMRRVRRTSEAILAKAFRGELVSTDSVAGLAGAEAALT